MFNQEKIYNKRKLQRFGHGTSKSLKNNVNIQFKMIWTNTLENKVIAK